jgi:outer membrane protein TolC
MRSCRFPGCLAAAGVLPLLLCLTVHALSDAPSVPKDSATEQALTLQACRQIALGNQPSIAAAQASVKAAMDRASALDNLRVPTCLARDLPIRRKQAALGVVITQAGVTQAEAETLYGVTFSYLAALHAGEQVRIANEQIRPRLVDLLTLVTEMSKGKQRRDIVMEEHLNLVRAYLNTLTGRVQEADQGYLRALAALREAMGVGPEFVLELPKRDLPCPRANPKLEELIALALAQRGELIQANTLAEIICLEIDAQNTSCKPTLRTFASGSDIHAKPIPSSVVEGLNYKPSFVGPEMPATLNGSKAARVQQAHDYHARALAGAVKTRNLIALEVEDLYRRWLDKSERAVYLERAYRESLLFSEKLKASFNRKTPAYPNIDEVITAGVITSRLQLEWKDAHYQFLLALAALERATAGAFAVDFDTAPACEPGLLDMPGESLKKQ